MKPFNKGGTVSRKRMGAWPIARQGIAAAWDMHGDDLLAGDPEAWKVYEARVLKALDDFDDVLELPVTLGEVINDLPTDHSERPTMMPIPIPTPTPIPTPSPFAPPAIKA